MIANPSNAYFLTTKTRFCARLGPVRTIAFTDWSMSSSAAPAASDRVRGNSETEFRCLSAGDRLPTYRTSNVYTYMYVRYTTTDNLQMYKSAYV